MQHVIFTTVDGNIMTKTEHFTDSIYYQFEQTAKYCRSLANKIFNKLQIKISPDEFATMDVIVQNSGICQRELAKIVLKDRANTGRILNSLEDKGLIKRFADTKNNRLVRKMELTPEGKNIYDNVSTVLNQYLENLPKVLPEEKKDNLMALIKSFRQSLEKEVEMNI